MNLKADSVLPLRRLNCNVHGCRLTLFDWFQEPSQTFVPDICSVMRHFWRRNLGVNTLGFSIKKCSKRSGSVNLLGGVSSGS